MNKQNRKTPFGKLAAYAKKSVPAVITAMILSAMGAVLTIIGPNKIGKMTTVMQQGLYGKIDFSAITRIGIFLVIIYLASALFQYIVQFIMATVTLNAAKRLRGDICRKINKIPMSYFNKTSQGDILSRVTNDVSTMQQGLTNSLPGIISAAAQFIGCLVMMIVTELRLALCVFAVTVLGMILLSLVVKHSQKYFIKRQDSLGKLNGYIEEMYSGHSVVRISKAAKIISHRFDALNNDVYDANWKSQFLSGIMQPLMNIIGNLGYVAVTVVGAILAIKGLIPFGVIVSFILYVRLFTSPLTQIAQGMTNMQMASASAERIFDFLETEELDDESEKKVRLENTFGKVEFRNVHFSYPDNPQKTIIKDFSATVKPSQKIAIVGPTGAGKTTMVNLLMRFFEISDGEILIDDVPLSDLKRENIHDLFAMVLQDTWLFDGTVRENLVYNLDNISDEELTHVCKVCGIYRFIHSLPNGFDTVLSENTTISAGQKQLLTIARAMLKKAPMLILDEATSSVDTRTETVIQRAMDELTKDKTSFVIAHRLSTIKNADLILVMKDGDVIESGTHNELMQQNGFYSELYNSQFEQTA